ncbi:MAG: metallophosphoesterase [Bacteroidota bacterium]|nr:metallophosphoesterase [Bacteroidota bacterium]
MYKIAHISDLHVNFNDEDGHGSNLIDLLSDIRDRNCDHVLVTGDIAENPDIQDFLYVRELFSHFDLLSSSGMSVIPGNHDIFGGAPAGTEFFRFPLICKKINYDEKLNQFIDLFKETFPDNKSFPYLKIINNIAIVGINSVDRWSAKNNPEGSNGRIDHSSFVKLKKILSSKEITDKYIIVLIHHHFNKPKNDNEYPAHSLWLKVVNYKMKLYGRKKITELFRKYKVNLVLHGHTHINEIYVSKKTSVINSSACSIPITDDMIRKYNIINIPGADDPEKIITVETILI